MLAALKGNIKCVELLLSELMMQDNEGNTALMRATQKGKADCVRFLLSEVKMVNKYG